MRKSTVRMLLGTLTFMIACVFATLVMPAMGAGTLTVRSPAFSAGQPIPTKYTCEGKNISPPLEIGGVPSGTKTLALIVTDPDAPNPAHPTMTWTHWIIFDLPVDVHEIRSAPGIHHDLPQSARSGLNSWHKPGYGGPCPPIGRHHYHFTVYALNTAFPTLDNPTREALLKAMKGHVIERADLIGTYEKQRH